MDSLEKLFEETVSDNYYAEKKILKALPKMAKKASSPKLSQAFEAHIIETEAQVERPEQVFELIGKAPRGKTCPAIDGIIEEGEEIMKEAENDVVRDAGMLAAAQAVEHYEITRYGTLKSWAGKLGMKDAVKLLDATLRCRGSSAATTRSKPPLTQQFSSSQRMPHEAPGGTANNFTFGAIARLKRVC